MPPFPGRLKSSPEGGETTSRIASQPRMGALFPDQLAPAFSFLGFYV
jgi:hypothetical protein